MPYFVYILASRKNGTLYVGTTNNLIRRVHEHRHNVVKGFTQKYGVKSLVYFEEHNEAVAAIQRERNLKHWSRAWKIHLIEQCNPGWCDLFDDITA